MTKENIDAVKEVDVVLNVVRKYLAGKQDMPVEVLGDVISSLEAVKEDYNKTINNLLVCNSLVVRLEKFKDIIGAISSISIEDEEKFDNIMTLLNDCLDSVNN